MPLLVLHAAVDGPPTCRASKQKELNLSTSQGSAEPTWTFKLSVAVLLDSGVNRVPLRHTPVRRMDSSTAGGTDCTGVPFAAVPCRSSNLHRQGCSELCSGRTIHSGHAARDASWS